MDLEKLTIGERIVALARVAAAEHIRQEVAASTEGIDEVARQLPPSPFSRQPIPVERFISFPNRTEVA
jgi:hypothetical protein